MVSTFAAAYPNLAQWVAIHGWIELGNDGASPSFIRVLDIGGLIWQGDYADEAVDEALQAAETAVAAWLSEQYGSGGAAETAPTPKRASESG